VKSDEIDVLILRYLSGELNPDEAELLRGILEKDPEAARRLLELTDEELLFRKGLRKSGVSKKTWVLLAASAAVLLFALLGSLWFFHQDPVLARVDRVTGSVVLLPARSPVKPGQELLIGQGLETAGAGSQVVLFLRDRSRLQLEAGTVLSGIDSGADGKRIRMLRGDLVASVPPQREGKPLRFSTPQGEAEVLGTKLRLLVDADAKQSTKLGVLEGKVRLKNLAGKSIVVPGGHSAVAAAGRELVLFKSPSIPPYPLPDPGGVTTIGVNSALDVAAAISTPPDQMSVALFGAFGAGTYVRDYSSRGAYVFTALGGHASPTQISGAVLFDFEDATWKGFENSNGIPSNGGGWTANSTGVPWLEWTGTEVPLPGHPYLIAAELPASRGGGPKGSVVFVSRAAVTADGTGARGPHALNLETRRWSRLTSADQPRIAGIYSSVIFDESSGRYYGIGSIESRKDRPYYDAADWSQLHATTPQYGWPAFGGGSRAFLDPVRRLIIDFADNRELHALPIDSPGAGWLVLPVSGALPPITSPEPNRFVFYPPDGNFYYRPTKNGGALLHRLIPPSGNALTQPWTADTVQLSQAMPDCDSVRFNDAWYSFFFYVPSIQSLAWVVGVDKPVYLLRPPSEASSPSPSAAPVITMQPEAQTQSEGATATFSVLATGTAPLAYQWQRNGTAIAGATAASYSTAALTIADNGASYGVIVSNTAGSATSQPALLTVTAASTPPPSTPSPVPSSDSNDKGDSSKCGCATVAQPPLAWGLLPALAAALLLLLLPRQGPT
jgi:hypothetical protein